MTPERRCLRWQVSLSQLTLPPANFRLNQNLRLWPKTFQRRAALFLRKRRPEKYNPRKKPSESIYRPSLPPHRRLNCRRCRQADLALVLPQPPLHRQLAPLPHMLRLRELAPPLQLLPVPHAQLQPQHHARLLSLLPQGLGRSTQFSHWSPQSWVSLLQAPRLTSFGSSNSFSAWFWANERNLLS